MTTNYTLIVVCVVILFFGRTWADKNDIAILKQELKEMKQKYDVLKHDQEEQNMQNQFLQTKIHSLENNFAMLQKENKKREDERPARLIDQPSIINNLAVEIQKLKGSVAVLQQDVTPKRGFSVTLKSILSNLGDNQIIIFDNVVSNIGNNYNPQTGAFTCEIPGMYVFFVNTLALPGKHAELQLMRNTQVVALTYAYDKEFYSSGSNMAVVDLQKGDTVVVKSNNHEHDSAGDILDNLYTSFSGFLVKS